jgi:hypothetical protein
MEGIEISGSFGIGLGDKGIKEEPRTFTKIHGYRYVGVCRVATVPSFLCFAGERIRQVTAPANRNRRATFWNTINMSKNGPLILQYSQGLRPKERNNKVRLS